jgi:lipid II:glycine glycyltransferase (peptidoglycan interpeptide bridge formation enzyme)
MKRQNRQNIRHAERDGITIREGRRDDLETFYRHYLATSLRQKFAPYPIEYFYRMWDIFYKKGNIGLILSEYENQPISGLLIVPFNDKVIAKLFGWSGQYAGSRPNEAVFWGAIQWAKTHGYHFFDLQGIDPVGAKALLSGQPLPESLLHTPTFMKLQFGGQVCLFPAAFEYVPASLVRWSYYKVLPWMTKSGLYKKLRQNMNRSSAGI